MNGIRAWGLAVLLCVPACAGLSSDAGHSAGGSNGASGAGGANGEAGIGGGGGSSAGVGGTGVDGGASGNNAGGSGSGLEAGSTGQAGSESDAGSGGAASNGSEAGSGGAAGEDSEGGSGGEAEAPAELVLPILRSGRYTLEFEDTIFQVSAAGGQVVNFSIKGQNILRLSADTTSSCPSCFGSTLWTSPQSDWGFPPPTAIDSDAYTASVTGNTITLVSRVSSSVGPKVSVTKKFTPDLSARAIDIQYSIKNAGNVAVSLAPWEVTRVAAGGLSFFPIAGNPYSTSALKPSLLKAGVAWIDLALNPTGNNKLFADGNQSYWAHTDGTYLFVKSWANVSAAAQATGEGEIEFYDGDTYVELENQGTYGRLAPGATRTFDVRWSLRTLHVGQDRVAGDPELLAAANALALH